MMLRPLLGTRASSPRHPMKGLQKMKTENNALFDQPMSTPDPLAAIEAERDAALSSTPPVGLVISDDGELLNWHGTNYVPQGKLNAAREALARVEALRDTWRANAGEDRDHESRTLRAVADHIDVALAQPPTDEGQ